MTGGSGTPADPYLIEGWEIDASTWFGVDIRSTAAVFLLRGNYIHSGGASFDGIYLLGVQNGVIDNNTVSGNQFGIRMDLSQNLTVSANNVTGNRGGIYLGEASNITIASNRLFSHVWHSVLVSGSSAVRITANQISTSQVGVSLSSSANVTIQGNTFTSDGVLIDGDIANTTSHTISADNLVNGEPLLYYKNCSGVTVDSVPVGQLIVANCADFRASGLDISNTDAGIQVAFGRNITLSSSRVSSNDLGILAESAIELTLAENAITDNVYGLFLQNLTDATLTSNDVSLNWRGTEFYASRFATLVGNLYTSNTDAAIILGSAHDVALIGNNVSDNGNGISYGGFSQNVSFAGNNVSSNLGWGVNLGSTVNVTLSANRISSNGAFGIMIGYGSNATVSDNVVANNAEGIRLYGSPLRGPPGVLVRHNSLVANGVQGADDRGPENVWDDGYPSGGNYWSNYAGVDNCSGPNQNVCPDSDGIGDTPYIVDGDSQDRYPFMQPPLTLMIETNPFDLQVRVDGVPYAAPYALLCFPGSIHTIEAPLTQTVGAATRFVFLSWSDGGAQAHDIVCDSPRAITANYRTQYWLTMDATASGVTLAPGSSWQDAGATVQIECLPPLPGPDTRNTFLGWSGAGPGSYTGALNPATITMAGPIVEVCGIQQEFRIVLDTRPTGINIVFDGTPFTTPLTFWCDAGSMHLAQAISPVPLGPDRRYTFLHWSDGNTSAVRTITCSAPGTYTAVYAGESFLTFDTTPAGLSVILDGTTVGTPSQRWCADGSSLSIGTASPQFLGTDRYEFDRWSDGGAQNHTITCTAPGTNVAFFLGPFAGSPSVTVASPNGGEDWSGGSGHDISWTMTDDKDATLSVTVDLSIDGGATFPYPLFSGSLPLGVNTFSWALPLVDTTQARMRVCVRDSDGLSACDTSDANFEIDSTRPDLLGTQPSNGAVGVDPNTFIVLTFSEAMNRVATEAAVTISPSPGTATFSWSAGDRVLTVDVPPLLWGTIYTITVSCGAQDISDPGNALANCAVSATFTTAVPAVPPQVAVTIPAGGEVWTGATPHGIEWTMTDPDSGDLSVDLTLSGDGGTTWTPIAGPIVLPQGTRTYVWVLPAIDSSVAMVRVCASDGTLMGCGTSAPFAIDSTPPTVVSVSPPDGATNVPLGALVVVTFSEPMNPATFPIPGVSLAPPVTGLTGTWSPDGRTLTFLHAPFVPCTSYTATVDVGGSDLSLPGNSLTIPYLWSFATECPPTATLLDPVGGEDWTGASLHQVRFRVGDESDLQLRVWLNVTVDGVTSTLFAGLVSVGETSMVWTAPSSSATATMSLTVVDGSGLTTTATSAPFAIDATPPALLTTDPVDGAGSAPVDGPLILTFSERMDLAGTEAALAITPAVGGLSLSWDPGGQVLTISFGGPLRQFTDYVVTIGCGARDASDPGNPLAGCPAATTEWRFTTEIVTSPPVAVAADVLDARVGEPVTLDGGASTGDIASWAWSITDDSGAVLATPSGAVVTHTFEEPGTYRVTLRVTDAFGRTDEYSFDVVVRAAGGNADAWILAIVTVAVLATILFAASEPGRVALLTATAGRVYAGKRKDEEDSEFRGAILYFVRVHPGDTYMDIKRNLGLNDGVVTYHLARLEKDGLIRSAVHGARKRYYPAEMRVPIENGGELHEIQQRILRVVAASPGMPVAVLAELLGVSDQLALYHLRKLSQSNQVNLERTGIRLRAYPGRTTK